MSVTRYSGRSPINVLISNSRNGNSDPHIRDHSPMPSFGTFVDEHVEERCERADELVAMMTMVAVHASRNEISLRTC